MARLLPCILALVVSVPGMVRAQVPTSFDDMTVQVGDTVTVLNTKNVEATGTVIELSPAALAILIRE